MGNLVLTRKLGESVQLVEPCGTTHVLTVCKMMFLGRPYVEIKMGKCTHRLYFFETLSFAGGTLEVRKHRRYEQVSMAFDFPSDVIIKRTELIEK